MTPTLQQHSCGASWMGYSWERCDWCAHRRQVRVQQYRGELLHPSWLQTQGPKYWELSPVDKRIWNRTRGIGGTTDVVEQWAWDLEQAVADGIITLDEAKRVLSKWQGTQLRNSTNSGS